MNKIKGAENITSIKCKWYCLLVTNKKMDNSNRSFFNCYSKREPRESMIAQSNKSTVAEEKIHNTVEKKSGIQ